MKEFIDKLIGRLEEHSFSLVINWEKGKYLRKDKAIEIVKELAEEYKGGWIPFDDPTCDSGNIPNGEVLVCKKDGTIDFDIYDFMRDDWKFNSKHHKNKVIAWQPLPEPYKAEEPQWKQAMMNTFLARK